MKKNSGFTLIELVLYVAIASIVLGAFLTVYTSVYQLRQKNQAVSEVEQQGQQVMQQISQTLRNAAAVTSPATGASSSALTLQTYSSGTNPTILSLSSGAVMDLEGTSSAVSLSSAKITVSSLSFQNLTRSGTHGIIKISFTVTSKNLTGRTENSFTKNFYNSAAVRGVYP